MPGEPLNVILEFARADQAGDPYGFRFSPQDYLLRSAGGGFESAQLVWNEALLADLEALRRPARDPARLARLGELLRQFLMPLGWAQHEQRILAAGDRGDPIVVTICSAAAELYALPWELLTLKSTGQHLGELPSLLLRYEWPETATAREQPAPREAGGRILLAWSAAGGAVPASEHLTAIQSACTAGFHPFDSHRDVLAHATYRQLADTLAAAQKSGAPISVLQVLCHGAKAGSTFGLALDAKDGEQALVDAGQLRQLLAPYAGMVRLVVLMACDGGNPGALGNQLGSVAQTLHRAGIATVVASRYPLSVSGSVAFAQAFYAQLLVGPDSLENAVLTARRRLAQDTGQIDWASLQLYAHRADGADTRPVVFRPYRGLAAFLPSDRRFYFGRERDVERIVKLLSGSERLVTVVGASGAGKSSLILAGVLPVLAPQDSGAGSLRLCIVRPALLRKGRFDNAFNRKSILLCLSVTAPMFINHLAGLRFGFDVDAAQLLDLNILFAMGVAATITIDTFIWQLAAWNLIGLLLAFWQPRQIGLIMAIFPASGLLYFVLVIRKRLASKKPGGQLGEATAEHLALKKTLFRDGFSKSGSSL